MGTAIHWFNPNLRVFDRQAFAEAYDRMALSRPDRQRVDDARRRLLAAR